MPLRRAYFMPPLTLAGPSASLILFSNASSTSAGPSMRIAPPKVNTHEKNGGVGATSTVARKWLASTTTAGNWRP